MKFYFYFYLNEKQSKIKTNRNLNRDKVYCKMSMIKKRESIDSIIKLNGIDKINERNQFIEHNIEKMIHNSKEMKCSLHWNNCILFLVFILLVFNTISVRIESSSIERILNDFSFNFFNEFKNLSFNLYNFENFTKQ